jgi:hypothetical protein
VPPSPGFDELLLCNEHLLIFSLVLHLLFASQFFHLKTIMWVCSVQVLARKWVFQCLYFEFFILNFNKNSSDQFVLLSLIYPPILPKYWDMISFPIPCLCQFVSCLAGHRVTVVFTSPSSLNFWLTRFYFSTEDRR